MQTEMAEGGRIQPQEPSAEMYPLPGDDVDSLRQQIQQLQSSLANMTQPVMPRIVLPPPVKLPTYSGIDDPEMWIERATRTVSNQQLTGEEAVLFLRDYLVDSADEEVRHQTPKNPTELFNVLRVVFGSKSSYSSKMREFYNRFQKTNETIVEYSHALVSLVKKMNVEGDDRENLLKQMFVDGVKSSNLKRYIGQKFRENPRITFLQLRQMALEENEEFPTSKAHVKELVVEQEQRRVECSHNEQAPYGLISY